MSQLRGQRRREPSLLRQVRNGADRERAAGRPPDRGRAADARRPPAASGTTSGTHTGTGTGEPERLGPAGGDTAPVGPGARNAAGRRARPVRTARAEPPPGPNAWAGYAGPPPQYPPRATAAARPIPARPVPERARRLARLRLRPAAHQRARGREPRARSRRLDPVRRRIGARDRARVRRPRPDQAVMGSPDRRRAWRPPASSWVSSAPASGSSR